MRVHRSLAALTHFGPAVRINHAVFDSMVVAVKTKAATMVTPHPLMYAAAPRLPTTHPSPCPAAQPTPPPPPKKKK